MKKALILLNITLLSALPLFAASASSGTNIFTFLKINPAARPAGMGNISSFATAQSMDINPAILPWLGKKEISAQHVMYISDVAYSSLAYAHPLDKKSAIGASLGYLGVGGLVKTAYDAANPEGYKEEGSFEFTDALAQLSFGRIVANGFSLGAGLKAVQESIDGQSTSGFMASFSGFYYTKGVQKPEKGVKRYLQNEQGDWQAGFGLFNIGPQVKGYNLPSGGFVSLGSWLGPTLFWGVEVVNYSDGLSEFKTGFEYNIENSFFVRAGYRYPSKDNSLGDFPATDVSAGFGVIIGNVLLDYAWVPYGDLGQTHRASLSARFGKSFRPLPKQRAKQVEHYYEQDN